MAAAVVGSGSSLPFVARNVDEYRGEATKRWEKLSSTCLIDNIIKGCAVAIIVAVGLVLAFGVAVSPLLVAAAGASDAAIIVISFLDPLMTLLTSVVVAVGSVGLMAILDWKDYSNKNEVQKDIVALTSQTLTHLIGDSNSVVFRVGNLGKYGILSKENVSRVEALRNHLRKVTSRLIGYQKDFSSVYHLAHEPENAILKEIYLQIKQTKEEQRSIETKWQQFQNDVVADLPKF